jgi:HEPN domain-containing protein
MKPITDEWVTKAEGDYLTARREFSSPESPNYDAVCFHAQQCAEKYLKARLAEENAAFPRTHNLAALLDLVLRLEPGWAGLRVDVDALTDLGIEVRYPGKSADAEDAEYALTTAEAVRRTIRTSFGLAS